MSEESPSRRRVTVVGGATLPRWALVCGVSCLAVGAALVIARVVLVSAIVGGVLIAVGLTVLALTSTRAVKE